MVTIDVTKDGNKGRQYINSVISKIIHPKDTVSSLPIKVIYSASSAL